MNRRKNYSLPSGDPLANRAPTFDGPVDHEVPVLWITDAEGETKAILFTYACHATGSNSEGRSIKAVTLPKSSHSTTGPE